MGDIKRGIRLMMEDKKIPIKNKDGKKKENPAPQFWLGTMAILSGFLILSLIEKARINSVLLIFAIVATFVLYRIEVRKNARR
jgi:Ca2+-dependent lipid-binding protein